MNKNLWKINPLSTSDMDVTARKAVAGDKQAIELLICSNIKLVSSIAYKYHMFADVEDLTMEGIEGLIKAIKDFDPDRGVKFTTHATWKVRGAILKYLLDNNRMVKIGTTKAQKKLFYRMANVRFKLEAEGLDVTDEAVAARLDVKVSEVKEMRIRMGHQAESSLDASGQADDWDGDAGQAGHDKIAGSVATPDHYVTQDRMQAWVKGHMQAFRADLTGLNLKVWDYRIAASKPISLQAIASDECCSRQYLSQIEGRLRKGFVKFARNRGGR